MLNKIWDKKIALRVISLGLPIIIGQLGSIFQQFADTMMVGNYGDLELSAAGFAGQVFTFVLYFLLGMSYASTPVVGSAFGEGNLKLVKKRLKESVIVNLLFSFLLVAILLLLYGHIDILRQPEEIMPVALPYYLVLTASVPFLAVFNALKQYSDAIGQTKYPMWIMLASNVLNIGLNYLLIFGKMGCPELGLLGAGVATLSARVFMVIAMSLVVMGSKYYSKINKQKSDTKPTLKGMSNIFFLGIPICVQLGLETAAFTVSSIYMGWISADALAGHQVMSTISTLCFQLVYGIGAAASIIISQYVGKHDARDIRRTASTALIIGAGIILFMMSGIYLFRYPLIGCFTDSQDIIKVILSILPCFMVYQIWDCTQIIFANALRGLGAVSRLMLYAFIAYVVVSLPLGYIFAFVLDYGPAGVWSGIPFGLATAGMLYYYEFRRTLSRNRV